MPVYVDAITVYPVEAIQLSARRHGDRWSHMWADLGDEAELHRIAAEIGLRREWFQVKGNLRHYDCIPSKRAKAIAAGAIERSLRDWLRAETPEQRTARREGRGL